ncbi:MAG TPA: Gfo/Idh/MocA family oxidoreductase [Gemmatimonadaceae bacterium]|nr:Gfo/Idh/MocA family oxidoreductase [Gemmatimonadaceae bacterium]
MRRRDFLRGLALAGGAPFVLGRGLRAAPPPRRQLGVALVGLGRLSEGQLGPALQRTQHCRLAGIVTGTPAKAARWQARYGIPARSVYDYATMARMADDPAIDIVYVVTPNALHMEHTIAAARAGKHVLCEKPMEVSVERCERMIAACREARRQLAIAYRYLIAIRSGYAPRMLVGMESRRATLIVRKAAPAITRTAMRKAKADS